MVPSASTGGGMRLALFYPWLEGAGGDPAYCRLLCDALARRGVTSVGLCRPGPFKMRESLVTARYPDRVLPFMLGDLRDLNAFLAAERSHLDALVVAGSFSPYNAGATLLARRHRIPYVVTPEGTVAPLAFTHGRRVLKRLYWLTVERWILSHAAAIRVLSDFEEQCLRALGIHTPMVLAPEGPEADALEAFGSYQRRRTSARTFVFLGRLDIWQKALDHVVRGFAAALREENRGQQLILAGPPLNGSLGQLRRLLLEEGLVEGHDVILHPPVYGADKWELLQRADVFLHPSRREGIPRSVVEALAMGVPAIVTPETNIATSVEHGAAGWRVEATPGGVRAGVLAAMAAPDLEARAANAARLARTQLSWDTIAQAFADGLAEILGRAAHPAVTDSEGASRG